MTAHSIFFSKLATKKNSYFLLFITCVIVVSLNLISSQSYPTLMYDLLQGREHSLVLYIKKIWGTPLYRQEMRALQEENRESVLHQMKIEEDERNKMFKSLEKVIEKYPYAPEPYYNLSLLYKNQGNTTKADEYLRKAQQIDPLLK